MDSICEQFLNVVAPMHELFVEAQKGWADRVIEQPVGQVELSQLAATVRALRAESIPTPFEFTGSRATMPAVAALQSS